MIISVLDVLRFEEGFSSEPYLCSEGYVTIGIGTRIHCKTGLDPKLFCFKVSKGVAQGMLNTEINNIIIALEYGENQATYSNLTYAQRVALMSMAYQMGVKGLYNFKRMWAALNCNNWALAEAEALDSRWAKIQSPLRATRHARVLGGESLGEVYGSLCDA